MTISGSDAGPSDQARQVTDTARDQAGRVGQTAADAGRDVAGTARAEAGAVTQEAKQQARDLASEARTQATQQVDEQRARLAQSIRSVGDELRGMADRSDQNGVATELARRAADRVQDVARYLDERHPGDLVEELRRLARRRPGTFLLGALTAGAVAGRLTRSAVSAQSSGNGARADYPPVPRETHTSVTTAGAAYTAGTGPTTLQDEALAQPGGPRYATPVEEVQPLEPVQPPETGGPRDVYPGSGVRP